MWELLGKIMAQVLSILAVSTREMNGSRIISEPIRSIYVLLTNYWVEKYIRSLFGLGNTEIPDALRRLDTLTREESGMAVARNLEITHDVDDNVKAMMGVTQDVDGHVNVIEQVTRNVDQNVKVIVDGTQYSVAFFMHVSTNFLVVPNSNERTKTYVTP
jgi:hypothetical protein